MNSTVPGHVLVDATYTATHRESYLPRIRKLLKKISNSDNNNTEDLVRALKLELSVLVTALTTASNLLQGGLFGSLDSLYKHLCPS